MSDLTANIRSKIDIIDIVQSGFANNIEDFSDAFWSIKDNIGGNEGYYQDLVSEITRTKVIVADGAEMKQFQIPTEARSRFVEIIKDDLIRDGGVVDTKALTQGNLTATAIKAARANLETRVSKFEWQAYKCATEVLELYFRLQGKEIPEFDVTFNTYHLDNVTETVQNAISVKRHRKFSFSKASFAFSASETTILIMPYSALSLVTDPQILIFSSARILVICCRFPFLFSA